MGDRALQYRLSGARSATAGFERGNTLDERNIVPVNSCEQCAEFIRTHYDAMLGRACSLCGDWHLAQDLVQESCLKLWRVWKTRRESVQWTRAYAVTVVRYTFFDPLDWAKRQKVLLHQVGAMLTVAYPEDPDKRDADRARVLNLLRELPGRHKEIFFLSEVGGFKPAEIAGLIGISPRTVSNYLSTTRKQLKQLFPPNMT